MKLRTLLRKRLHVSLVDPSLPAVQAAGEDIPPTHGFSFGIDKALGIAGLAATLIGGYVDLRSKDADTKAEMRAQLTDAQARITSLNQRVVNRTEVEAAVRDLNIRIDTLQAGQTQIVGHLLQEKN